MVDAKHKLKEVQYIGDFFISIPHEHNNTSYETLSEVIKGVQYCVIQESNGTYSG